MLLIHAERQLPLFVKFIILLGNTVYHDVIGNDGITWKREGDEMRMGRH